MEELPPRTVATEEVPLMVAQTRIILDIIKSVEGPVGGLVRHLYFLGLEQTVMG